MPTAPERCNPTIVSEEPGTQSTDVGEDVAVLTFSTGLPGFPEAHHFTLASLGKGMDPFCRLVCADRNGVEFVAVPPEVIFSDYTVRIDEDTATELEITNPKDALILNIVTLPALGQNGTPTVNLLGPIIVNRQTRAARQIVLHDSDYSVAAPIVPAR